MEREDKRGGEGSQKLKVGGKSSRVQGLRVQEETEELNAENAKEERPDQVGADADRGERRRKKPHPENRKVAVWKARHRLKPVLVAVMEVGGVKPPTGF